MLFILSAVARDAKRQERELPPNSAFLGRQLFAGYHSPVRDAKEQGWTLYRFIPRSDPGVISAALLGNGPRFSCL